MGLESAITLLEDVFINTSFFNTLMIPQMIIIFASMLIVTRKFNDWGKLALPMMIAWSAFGMHISIVLMIIAGIIFTINHLSISISGGGLKTFGQIFSRDRLQIFTSKGRENIKKDKRMDKDRKEWDKLLSRLNKDDRYRNLSELELGKISSDFQERNPKEFGKSDNIFTRLKLQSEENRAITREKKKSEERKRLEWLESLRKNRIGGFKDE